MTIAYRSSSTNYALSASGSGHRPLRLYWWADRLYRYYFTVEDRPGRYNQMAYFLSRVKLPEDHSTSRKPTVDQFEDSEMIQMLVTVSDITKQFHKIN